MNIRQFTEQEQAEFKAKHSLAEPKPWAVMDGSLLSQWYDTEEEARAGLKQANIEEEVATEFDVWVEEQAEKYGVSETEILSIIK